MSSSRKVPTSNIGRLKAGTTAKAKKDSLPVGGNAMSVATAARLDLNLPAYKIVINAVIAAEQAQHAAGELANPHRTSLHNYVGLYIGNLEDSITMGTSLPSARAFFGLPINKKTIPLTNTDERLVFWGNKIITGDAARILAGGPVFTGPTIAQFNTVFADAETAIMLFSNAKTVLTDAQNAVNLKNPEMNTMIKRMWDEIETTYSEQSASAKRAACRQWGVRYLTLGLPAILTGTVTDSISGLPLAGVKLHLEGVGTKFLSDALGNFTINTNLYGDLTLIATLANYTTANIDLLMANGGTMVQDVSLVHH